MCHHITLLVISNNKAKTKASQDKLQFHGCKPSHHKVSILPTCKFHIQSLSCFLGGSWTQNNLWQMQHNVHKLVFPPILSAVIINESDKHQTLSLCIVFE